MLSSDFLLRSSRGWRGSRFSFRGNTAGKEGTKLAVYLFFFWGGVGGGVITQSGDLDCHAYPLNG